MRISGNPGNDPVASSAPAPAVRSPAAPASAAAGAGTGVSAPAMQSGVLQPALEALREMPDIDQARVAELREALARGELRFDAGKLAELITRYHGKRS